MFRPFHSHARILFVSGATLAASLIWCFSAGAQPLGPQPVQVKVEGPNQRLEMIVNTSRILTLENKVPEALVNNPDVVRLFPISPNQYQVAALKPGVTQVNLRDEKGQFFAVDVIVYGDAQELQMILKAQFPTASTQVIPLASSVLITGSVPRPEMVSRIVRIAEDYYPKVINNMTVEGVQQVLLHVKIMEVSRTKLRALGFDWAVFGANASFISDVSGLIAASVAAPGTATGLGGETIQFGIVDGSDSFFGVLEALRANTLAKVLAEPTLVTVSGRPASFKSGGEFPILVPQSLGTVSIEYKAFGTRVDFVPIVLGNGAIRLEVRPQISEIDNARSVTVNNVTVPGLRDRWVDTAVEMKAGQTLALAGLIQTRVESENRGVPWVADIPWAGAAFRRVQETINEVELVVLVRPELVEALDPHEVPRCGPGEFTTSPSDVDLYWRGYNEVPKCCLDGSCPDCQPGGPAGPSYELVPPGTPSAPPAVPARRAPLSPSARQPGPGARGTPAPVIHHGGPRTPEGINTPPSRSTANVAPSPSPSQAAVAPVDSTGRNHPSIPSNRYLPVSTSPVPSARGGEKPVSEPQLIGPRGYDVLD
jgi:pilus assembly protein CpaC